jgi:GT2 family glycosyltransferase
MINIQVSIIIVNYNSPELLTRCVNSIDKFVNVVSKEVIVVDNNSKDEQLDYLENKFSYVRSIRLTENLGFGQANNIGVKNAKSEVVLLLNSDTEFIDASINDTIKKFYENTSSEMWGLKLLWSDGRFQNSFSRKISFFDFLISYSHFSYFFNNISFIKNNKKYHKYDFKSFDEKTSVDIIYGTAMLISKKDFSALNGFSKNFFMYFEDIDLCERFLYNGGKIFIYPYTQIIHHVAGSKKNKFIIKKIYETSLYLYGIKKFGFLRMLFFCFIDVICFPFVYLFRKKHQWKEVN